MGLGAAIAGVISTVSSFLGSGTLAAGLTKAALSAAISIGVSKLTAGKPKLAERPGRKTNVRTATMAHQVVLGKIRKGGLLAYVNGTGNKNKYLHTIVVFAAHECQSIDKIYIGGLPVQIDTLDNGNVIAPTDPDETDYHDYAFFQTRLGTATQSAFASLITETSGLLGEWTAAHQIKGRCCIYGKFRESPSRYGGVPPVTGDITGNNQIYDTRDSSTAWSENPALQAAWVAETYLNIPRARIDSAALITAANVCDEAVPLKAGGTQKRYTSNGFFDLEGDPANWLEPIIMAMAGAFIEHDGIYYIHAGQWVAPEITITDDDFINGAEIVLRTAQSNIERSNAIKGIFVSPDTYDSPTEFPMVKDTAMIAEDGGVENVLDLDSDLEFCNSHQQAQRVAKIMLRRQRLDETFTVDVHLRVGLDVKPWDNVTVNSAVLGVNGTFRIVEHVLITDENGPLAFVRLTLQKHEASVYDWSAATDEQDLVEPSLNIPNNEGEPQVKVHVAGDGVTVPGAGVDNDSGNVGDVVIDLENRKIVQKRGVFSN